MSLSESTKYSRQRRWQLRKAEQGLCQICGKRKAIGSRCRKCGIKTQERRRAEAGFNPKKDGGAGRPAIYKD